MVRKRHGVVSPATIATKCLMVWIYLDAGFGKLMDPLCGCCYYNASSLPALDTYVRHTLVAQYAYALLQPQGLRLLTPLVVYVELLAMPVALISLFLRNKRMVVFSIVSIVGIHVGIALTMRVALFHRHNGTEESATIVEFNHLYWYFVIRVLFVGK